MKKEESYYGGYFWLTLISFVVPVFVAFNAFDKVSPTTKPIPTPDASGVDHNLWDYLLKTYVENGLVDYAGIKRDYLFKVYLRQLGGANMDALSTDDEKLALYCNAYNAFVIEAVINHQLKGSVNEFEAGGRGFFNQAEHLFGNQTYTLNELEHQIVRPTFQEPRIHMAFVCAAMSCPSIRKEAYVGERLDKQLEDQALLFANDRHHVYFDEKSNKIMVNSILKWYGEDWDSRGGYLKWLAERARDSNLKARLLEADQKRIEVGFIPYDWTLNSQGPVADQSHSKSEAGSGTIPNE